MADISQIKIGNTTYNIKDTTARQTKGIPSTSGHNTNDVLVIDDTTLNPPTADWYALNDVLPNMDQNDFPSNGDVIAYNSSTHKAEWQTPQSGLPDYSGASNGDVLTVQTDDKSGSNYVGWVAPSGGGGLPDITDSDNGKVLQATYDDKSGTGFASWVTPSGGGGSSIQTAVFAKSAFDYDDKSGIYTLDISSARIEEGKIINIQTTNSDAGSMSFQNFVDECDITSNYYMYYTMVVGETAYQNLKSYVRIVYYT